MRAIRVHAFGGPGVLQLDEIAQPVAAAGEVLVRITAAGVNPIDLKTRAGGGVSRAQGPLPFGLGWDLAGDVAALGADVTGFAIGDRVYAMSAFPQLAGCYAEYAVVRASELAHAPKTLTAVEAAALPLAALTAWQALFEAAALAAGQTLVVNAAAGGVGHLAVQLAKWRGAQVIGVASARNVVLLERLGCDRVVDYTQTRISSAVQGADVVLDPIGGPEREECFAALRDGGVLVSLVGPADASAHAARGVRGTNILVRPDAGQLAEIAALADGGQLRPIVEAVLALEDAPRAHELVETGRTRGKVVLRVREETNVDG